jgi:pyrimidine and pyridine-specific 5'-nucleotidase
LGPLPHKFTGLAVREKNLMSMQLTHEKVVVGFADQCGCGATNLLGHEYVQEKIRKMVDNNYENEEEECSDEGDASVDRSFILGA